MLREVKKITKQIFKINSNQEFENTALEIFRLQSNHVPIYKNYLDHLNIVPSSIGQIKDIPFLPIEFFKSHKILLEGSPVQRVFESSGTTGAITSKHYVSDLALYDLSCKTNFEKRFGAIESFEILALLPSYLERDNSSLVYMTKRFMDWNGSDENGFYLDNLDELVLKLKENEKKQVKTLLIGVTFGLLDLCDKYQLDLKNTIVIETGGMKGRKKEMVRDEVHGVLKSALGAKIIGSEYGMTELLSQAWSEENGIFKCPSWMKASIREVNDPFSEARKGKTGGINIIDLANIYSCSFIATQDLGKQGPDDTFEVLGRFDHSDVRGCNLMAVSN